MPAPSLRAVSRLATCLLAANLLAACGPTSAGPAPNTDPPQASEPAPSHGAPTDDLATRPLDPVLAQAIQKLGDQDRTERTLAATVIRERADEASPALRRLASDHEASPVARALAVRILAENETDARFFCSIYTGANGKVALELLEALVRCGVDAVPCLTDALAGGTAADRAAVVRALVEIGTPAIPALIDASSDPEIDRRVGACAALSRLVTSDSPHAPELLRSALAFLDDDEEIARRTGRDAIVNLGAAAIPPLVSRIRDPQHPHREFVATTLAELGSPAFGPLAELTRDTSPKIRKLAFHGFTGWSDWNDTAVDTVTRGFGDPDIGARMAAFVTIRNKGDTRVKHAIPALFDALASERLEERRIAETTLISIGPAVGHRLPRLIANGTDTQKLHATRIAGQLPAGADSCIPSLEALAASTEDDRLRAEVETSLRRIRKKAERR